MKKYMLYILAAVLTMITFNANAQPRGRVYYDGYGYREDRLIDWLPTEETPRRYSITVRPFQLINDGLKLDFEMELNTPGQWLQFSLAGYYLPQFDPSKHNDGGIIYSIDNGWENFLSDHNDFQKMGGAGLGVTYKSIFTNSGWYWSAGAHFTYFNVSHKVYGYYSLTEDGMEFHEYRNKTVKSRFYKPGFNINLGKHFALSRNIFFDAYIGLGYERTFYGGAKTDRFQETMFSFDHTGPYISGGFRIGWMWPCKK